MEQNSGEPDRGPQPPFAGLSWASLILRLMTIGVVIAGIASLFAYAAGWLPHALTPARIVNTLEEVNGPHPGFRRNHAKGVCVSGYFNSNGQGTALSQASIFQPGRVPAIGRFSLSGGGSQKPRTPPTQSVAWRFSSCCRTARNGALP